MPGAVGRIAQALRELSARLLLRHQGMWELPPHTAGPEEPAEIDLASKLAFLSKLGALDGAAERVETHMSWVFLTEHRALKLKKPVKLPYLDYRTVEQRRRSCEQELRLGRRLAASVYLDLVPLVMTRTGLELGSGRGRAARTDERRIVDWLVVMRRLAADEMLPQRLARGVATEADAVAVADVLSAYYRVAPRSAWDGPEYRHRLRNLNISVAGELVERGTSRDLIGRIIKHQLTAIEREARALDARIAAGRVVDGHGDLRPEHICLETPPVIIDPLEFDDELRMLDTASELEFLALECERLDARWFAARVIARCAECLGDQVPAGLAALYHRQHALTRALIALRHLDDAPVTAHPGWRAKGADYLARAGAAPH